MLWDIYSKKNQIFMPINKEWHLKHKMPKNPTLEQRIKWHLAHEKHCTCRPIPDKLNAVIDSMKIKES